MLITEFNRKIINTAITIPAYDNNGNGLIVELDVDAEFSETLIINAIGSVAIALQKNFQRIIEIMASINKSWEILKYFNYRLKSCSDTFKVNDARSSSLALSICLLNIYREIINGHQIKNVTGTGVLRIDGSFEETYLEQQKYFAVKNKDGIEKKFITSSKCTHLFELEDLLNKFKYKNNGVDVC
jgi:hypothetical protein